MKIAAAQTYPKRYNTEQNLLEHYRLIDLAVKSKVDLLIFPEMSLTGYEREEAKQLAFTPNDTRLEKLRQLSHDHNITLVVGAPIQIDEDLFIGSFIIEPHNKVSIYTKQFLHTGEEVSFKPSFDYNPMIELKGERISFAICADIENPQHAKNAAKNKPTLYLASIFYTPTGISSAYSKLSSYAKQYNMSVLMSDFCGQSYGFEAAGKSAFWNNKGELICNLNENKEGLLIVEKQDGKWNECDISA